MKKSFRKTALLVGACSMLGAGFPAQAFAASPEASVQDVQQAKRVSGTVNDAMGPIIGASVVEKGTSNGTVTDLNGNFTLSVKPGATIVVTYIGFIKQEIKVGNQSSFNIELKEDATSLEEVVVVLSLIHI